MRYEYGLELQGMWDEFKSHGKIRNLERYVENWQEHETSDSAQAFGPHNVGCCMMEAILGKAIEKIFPPNENMSIEDMVKFNAQE